MKKSPENECLVGRGPVLENQTIKEQIIKKRSVGLVLGFTAVPPPLT